MKKLLAMILTVLLVLSMTAAFADGEKFTKSYKLADGAPETAESPIETFTFTALTCTSVTDAADGVTTANAPVPTVATAPYTTAGGATTAGGNVDVAITLPNYTSVGIYTYTFKEVDQATAGVDYYQNDITLVVTVQQTADGLLKAVAVHCESPIQPVYIVDGKEVDADGKEITEKTKTDVFENTYSAGTLTVNKQVTGNMGDQSKPFTVRVNFTAPSGKTVKDNQIMYTVGDQTLHATPGTEVVLELAHNDTVTFTNIPKGVAYTVVEDSYADDGYEAAKYQLGEAEASETSISSDIEGVETDAVVITNEKNVDVDTGITLEVLPYVLVLAVVLAGVALMIIRRRRNNED